MQHKFSAAVAVVAVVVGSLLAGSGIVHATGPYFPPNPPPMYVEPGDGHFALFPLPGLYLGFSEPGQPESVEREIKVTDDLPDDVADPVMGPPKADGQPDSTMEFGLKNVDPDNPFVGIATAFVTLCVKPSPSTDPPVCHTYSLVLYVGVPIPDTGADTGRLVAAGAAAVLLGGGLMVISRRRRLVPLPVR
ncbi:MAG TPA: LPXTG cell wall anchor domain-containing protein [Ilumatobacteraceae bacterium]|nr:LPXTG cell wall anchor domain-containing protein [Ilumatobacteraceae bacterium]